MGFSEDADFGGFSPKAAIFFALDSE